MDQPRTIAASRRMLIDGKWCEASNGATYAVPNPATEEIIGTAPDATVDDMQRAIGAARRAFDEGPWPRSDRHERARVLTRIADAMERRKEEMRQLVIAEAGAVRRRGPRPGTLVEGAARGSDRAPHVVDGGVGRGADRLLRGGVRDGVGGAVRRLGPFPVDEHAAAGGEHTGLFHARLYRMASPRLSTLVRTQRMR